VRLYIRHGSHHTRMMRYGEAIEVLEKACALAETCSDPQLQEADYRLGNAYNITGWPLKAQQVASRSLRQGKLPGRMYGHLVMSNARYNQDDPGASLEHARLGRQIAQSLGSPWMNGCFLVFQTRAELALGQVDAAWEHSLEEIGQARSQKHFDLLCMALCAQGDIYRLFGDTGSAIRAYRAALEVGVSKWDSLTVQHHLAIALLNLGEVDEGLRQAEEAYLHARQWGLEAVAIPALASLSMLLALAGRSEQAVARQEEWMDVYRERNFNAPEIVEGWAMSLDASLSREAATFERQAQATIRRACQRGNPWWELSGYRRLRRYGSLDDEVRKRVWDLLDGIKRQVRHPDLLGLVEAYGKENRAVLIGL
jgi:tetratricopeptide (TPR) repeat protein